jgi:dnd system-associated protein 4
MNDNKTIADVAERAIKSIGKPSTAEEIHAEIVRLDLYRFNSPTPVHVLETELKRYSAQSQRSDKRENSRFTINSDKTYGIVSNEPFKMKRAQTIGMKRIMRASDKEELIEELISSRVGLFKEIWRLLLFAAQIGMQARRRETLRAVETGKGIDQATFGNSSSWPGILYLMGLVEAGDSQMLDGSSEGEDQRVLLFQEYANGGLSIMRDFFKDRAIDLDGVLAFIQSHQGQNATLTSPDLDLTI